MSAGLPGLGLGGLFFIISALLAPIIEVVRIACGRGRDVDWPQVWRSFALALTMIFAVDLTLRALYAVSHLFGFGDTPRIDAITVIPLVPVAITACLLATVLLTAKAVDLATPVLRDMPRFSAALPSRSRVLALTGLVAAIWFALLFSGANDLTPLPGRDGGNDRAPSTETLADADAAKDTVVVAGARASSAQTVAVDTVPAPPITDEASGDGPGAQPSTAGSASDIGAGSTAPAGAAPATTQGAVPADGVEPAEPAPSPSAPETTGPAGGTATPSEPATEPAPSETPGPPAGAGPPEGAGPPDHSNAPPGAGPG